MDWIELHIIYWIEVDWIELQLNWIELQLPASSYIGIIVWYAICTSKHSCGNRYFISKFHLPNSWPMWVLSWQSVLSIYQLSWKDRTNATFFLSCSVAGWCGVQLYGRFFWSPWQLCHGLMMSMAQTLSSTQKPSLLKPFPRSHTLLCFTHHGEYLVCIEYITAEHVSVLSLIITKVISPSVKSGKLAHAGFGVNRLSIFLTCILVHMSCKLVNTGKHCFTNHNESANI